MNKQDKAFMRENSIDNIRYITDEDGQRITYRQAELIYNYYNSRDESALIKADAKAFKRGRESMREECAKVAEGCISKGWEPLEDYNSTGNSDDAYDEGSNRTAKSISESIRQIKA